MKVRAKVNLLYDGKIYKEGTEFEMDDVSVGIAGKYGKIEKLQGGDAEPEIDEGEPVDGLPPLPKKKK